MEIFMYLIFQIQVWVPKSKAKDWLIQSLAFLLADMEHAAHFGGAHPVESPPSMRKGESTDGDQPHASRKGMRSDCEELNASHKGIRSDRGELNASRKGIRSEKVLPNASSLGRCREKE